jgi:hypothetical protein
MVYFYFCSLYNFSENFFDFQEQEQGWQGCAEGHCIPSLLVSQRDCLPLLSFGL